MRNLICLLALAGIIGLGAGCARSSFLPPSLTQSKYNISEKNRYEKSRERFQAIAAKDVVIDGLDSLSDIMHVYKKYKKICTKSQFDTEDEVYKKCSSLLNEVDELNKTYTVYIPNFKDIIRNEIKYDPNDSKFVCRLPYLRVPGTYDSPFAILLSGGEINISGGYTGVNAFGATVGVKKFRGKGILLCSTNGKDLQEKVFGKHEIRGLSKQDQELFNPRRNLSTLTFASSYIPKEDAQARFDSLGFVVKFKPFPKSYAGEMYLYREDTVYDGPTISSPYDSKIKYSIIHGEILSIYIADKKDGKVFGGYTFYSD